MGSAKQRVFLAKFFECNCNATEAARQAGYKHPNKQGPRLQKKLQAEIDARLDEIAMPANEVLARLGAVGRSDISEFIDDSGKIDFAKVKEKGSLIKRIVHQKGSRSTIELHDSLTALMHLDKYHGGKGSDPIPTKIEGDVIRIVEHTGDE